MEWRQGYSIAFLVIGSGPQTAIAGGPAVKADNVILFSMISLVRMEKSCLDAQHFAQNGYPILDSPLDLLR